MDLTLVEGVWPFAEENPDRIASHWAQAIKNNPALWDGKLLLAERPELKGKCLQAKSIEVSYSSYLAWRDWGYPEKTYFTVFGSAIIRSREGYLIFGEMAEHTAGAGLIYPPAGSLERSDVGEEGRIDVFSSAVRELCEETGLDVGGAGSSRSGIADFACRAGQLISVNRVFQFERSAAALVEEISAFMATQDRAELGGVVVLKTLADVEQSKTEPYAIGIAKHLLG